ncbi:MAG TPA: hypothetical protein VJ124_02595 [Pyrinomonadaceae bacterium]|nr:hypothetical protein [Pyrinomonadaceae bacterium]
MRLKLVLLAALLAAIAGSGASIAIIITVFSSLRPIVKPGLLVLSTFLLPTAAVLLASIFVYRHTARRRKLQALLTVIIATLLTLALFIVASIFSSRTEKILPPTPAGPQVIGVSLSFSNLN